MINTKKTEVLYQPNSTRTREEDIMVDGNKLNSVLEFTYLGSTISSNGCIDDEIQRRMADYARDSGTTTEPRPGHCTDDRCKSCMPS